MSQGKTAPTHRADSGTDAEPTCEHGVEAGVLCDECWHDSAEADRMTMESLEAELNAEHDTPPTPEASGMEQHEFQRTYGIPNSRDICWKCSQSPSAAIHHVGHRHKHADCPLCQASTSEASGRGEASAEAAPQKESFAQIVRATISPLKGVVADEVYRDVFIRVLALYTTAKALNRVASADEVARLREALLGVRARTVEGWGECWCEHDPYNSTNIVDHEDRCAAARAALEGKEEE